jgi:long-chain acyl-CoA synthetase
VFGGSAAVYCQGFGMPIGPHAHLVCGPLYHAGPSASATAAIHAGNTLVLMRRWTPEGFLERVERHRVASTQMVPTMFHRLLALPEQDRARYDVSSVRSVMHTGAPCPMHVKQRFMDWFGPVVYETYGGTESVATIATPRRWLQKPGTVGKPIRGVTVHILDDDGNECPPGTSGAIYIESHAGARAEYFKDPEKTASMRRGDLVTLGDVGYLDEDGYLFLNDRKVDMVISGGVNIYPAEIESVLLQSPLVADVAVIGVPDEEWGEQVMAVWSRQRTSLRARSWRQRSRSTATAGWPGSRSLAGSPSSSGSHGCPTARSRSARCARPTGSAPSAPSERCPGRGPRPPRETGAGTDDGHAAGVRARDLERDHR